MLEVTSDSVRVSSGGTGREPSRQLVEAALDWIDDPVGLFEERPVAVADMWRSLIATLLGPRCDAAVVVHPPHWPHARVDRVVAAANTVTDHVRAVSADRWDRGAPRPLSADDDPGRAGRDAVRGRPRVWVRALLVGAGAVLLGGAVIWVWPLPARPAGAGPTVVEGRMAVRIPARWTVQRVTGGPGARRLQVTSPDDPRIALHLTSAYAPGTTHADAADVLARAIADEPPGVFADFRAEATVAGRRAVTYREFRPGRVITWIVVLTGSTRVSIGCQAPPGRDGDIRAVCDDAVRSAQGT